MSERGLIFQRKHNHIKNINRNYPGTATVKKHSPPEVTTEEELRNKL